jgi:hypothetical protein
MLVGIVASSSADISFSEFGTDLMCASSLWSFFVFEGHGGCFRFLFHFHWYQYQGAAEQEMGSLDFDRRAGNLHPQ